MSSSGQVRQEASSESQGFVRRRVVIVVSVVAGCWWQGGWLSMLVGGRVGGYQSLLVAGGWVALDAL
jgi:hypothetical protein